MSDPERIASCAAAVLLAMLSGLIVGLAVTLLIVWMTAESGQIR